jgi:ferritin
MLKKAMQRALNEQINAELYSSYLYLAMSAWCHAHDLNGMGGWFRVQAQEELIHVGKFFTYVLDRDGSIELAKIDAPPVEWKSALAAFEGALEHEQKVTTRVNKLVDLARKDGDHSTDTFLQWFVNEQIEEEATARQIVGQLRLIGENGSGLYLLDKELGARVFVYPAPGAEAPPA